MKNVLVLGAGFVAPPLVRYLLARPRFRVIVASDDPKRARRMVGDNPRGAVRTIDARDDTALDDLIKEADLVVSLLPAALHPRVARIAVARRVSMITTSYVSAGMRALDGPARSAGVLLLNEIGLDPGLDHMSAVAVIERLRRSGKKVTHLSSCCGGIPAPDANDNPWGYKFSWSPKGVLLAARSGARYRSDGKTIDIAPDDLFRWRFRVAIDGLGQLEVYPNRDSLPYAETYGIPEAAGIFRGTYRWPGWCRTLDAVKHLGLLDETDLTWPTGYTWARLTTRRIPGSVDRARQRVARFFGIDAGDPLMQRLEWAGLLADEPLPRARAAPLDLLCERLTERMAYAPAERDLVVLRHDFAATRRDGRVEHWSSVMTAYGRPGGDSAMARTVALPAAIAARLVLERRVAEQGVLGPVEAGVVRPVLDELDQHGIRFVESARTADPRAPRMRQAKGGGS